jgi:hypothetical protein
MGPFIGRYELAPGFVDNVHWEHGGLVATATGETVGAQLTPVSPTAFRPSPELGTLTTFERDEHGRVVAYIFHLPNGQIRRARKLD